MISGKDNKTNKPNLNNYLDNKNKKSYRTSGENIDNRSNSREEHKTKYSNKLTSILPTATDSNILFENKQAEQNNIKNIDRQIKKCKTKLIQIV